MGIKILFGPFLRLLGQSLGISMAVEEFIGGLAARPPTK